MTRAHITVLALILAVASWGPAPSARAQSIHDDPPRPPSHLTSLERVEIVPISGAEALRRPASPNAGPPELAAPARVAFQSYRDGNWEIYLADGAGGNPTRFTNNAASDIMPRLNRGATRLLFVSMRDGNYEIYSANIDGSGLRRLTNSGAEDYDPYWSPDGNRIVFSSKRDGQYEIYAMNADGSGVTRLTNDAGSDTEPTFSPDGARIAFISTRNAPANTGGRVWVMNANGSNPHAVSITQWSLDPVWSPDGTRIAYAGLANADDWLDAIIMGSNGESPVVAQYGSAGDLIDWHVNTFSPDGRYLGLSWWDYVVYNNTLYLETAVIWYIPLFGSPNGLQLSFVNQDMYMDSQWADLTPPTTAVQALPAVSPADFTVTWSGSAADGPAQKISYEVQMREGLTGTWMALASAPWNTPNTKAFHGLGGRTYYFRSRGIDDATNVESWPEDADAWTTIESLAPVSSMSPLDPLTRATTLLLQWTGVDLGGSGIAGFDVEVREGTSTVWTRLLTTTLTTTKVFAVTTGNTYHFRVRAVDAAGNTEDWPADDGDTQSTLFSWRSSGHIFDARGAPVDAAAMIADRGGTLVRSIANNAGLYATLLLTSTPTVTVTWSKLGYGDLPATVFSITNDLAFNAYLPPIDNIVDGPDFEASTLGGTQWQILGLPGAKPITEVAHTGYRAIEIGGLSPPMAINVSASISDSRSGQLVVDPAGAPHLVWIESRTGREAIAHAERSPSGAWIAPEILSAGIVTNTAGDPDRDKPAIGFDAAGTAHVVWRNAPSGEVFYVNRPAGGMWSAPLQIASGLSAVNASAVRLAVSAAGRVHVTWHSATAGRSDIYYRGRDTGGVWGPLENVTGDDPFATEAASSEIAVDAAETAHLAWQNGIGYYASRPVSGTWSAPFGVTVWPFLLEQTRLSVDATGQARAAWLGHAQSVNAIVYATIEGGFATSTQLAYTSTQALTLTRILIDGGGQTQLGWSRGDGEVFHASPGPGGWTSTNVSASPSKTSSQIDLLPTTSGLWAVWREQEGANTFGVACKKRTLDGQWHALNACVGAMAGLGSPALAAGPDNRAHLAFGTPSASAGEQYYAFWDDAGPRGAGLAQTLDITTAMAGPVLSFLYRLDVPAGENAPVMTVSLESASGGTAIFTTTASTNGGWTHVWRDLSAWSGQAVTLAFQLDPMSGVGRARLLLDEVNVGSIPADTWLMAQTVGHAPPGGQIVIDVAYGNRGAGIAAGAVLTAALPAGLAFVAADPAPISTSPLIWQLPDMASNAGPFAIQITATIAPDQPLLAPLTVTFGLDTLAVEVDPANNTWRAAIFIGYRAYLPDLEKP